MSSKNDIKNRIAGKGKSAASKLMETVHEVESDVSEVEEVKSEKVEEKPKTTKRFNVKDVENPYILAALQDKEEREKQKVENTHKRATFYVENELLSKLDEVVGKTKITKVKLINDILGDFIKELENEGFPFK